MSMKLDESIVLLIVWCLFIVQDGYLTHDQNLSQSTKTSLVQHENIVFLKISIFLQAFTSFTV